MCLCGDTQCPFCGTAQGTLEDDPYDFDQNFGVWECLQCGEEADPVSSKWRWAGDHWQHHHDYPVGHVEAGYIKYGGV